MLFRSTSIPELKQVKKVSVVKRDSTKRYRNHITWSAVKGADKYLIYVKYKKSGSFKKLATTKKTSYTHKYKKNRTVFYRLTATAKSNNKVATSPYSKVVRVKKRK